MTSVAVLGDSRSGKTAFMHKAVYGRVPLNIFTSTSVETFYWVGALHSSADFHVVPGACSNNQLVHALCGVDAILVLYKENVQTAQNWLWRATRSMLGVHNLPVIVVCTGTSSPKLADSLLRAYPCAEHAVVTTMAGAQDCVNRIVMRARRDPPSPLELRFVV